MLFDGLVWQPSHLQYSIVFFSGSMTRTKKKIDKFLQRASCPAESQTLETLGGDQSTFFVGPYSEQLHIIFLQPFTDKHAQLNVQITSTMLVDVGSMNNRILNGRFAYCHVFNHYSLFMFHFHMIICNT